MVQVLLKILPLDIAATLSPGLFALALFLLGSTFKPKLRTFGFFLGTLIVGIGISLAGFFIGQAVSEGTGETLPSAIFDLVFGLVFVYFAVKSIISRDREIKTSSKEEKYPAMRWILLGIILSVTNFDALFLCLNAAKEVSVAEISLGSQIFLIIINLIFFTSPITIPLIFYLIVPKTAEKILSKANNFVLKYARYLIFVIFVIFATILIYRGLKYFI